MKEKPYQLQNTAYTLLGKPKNREELGRARESYFGKFLWCFAMQRRLKPRALIKLDSLNQMKEYVKNTVGKWVQFRLQSLKTGWKIWWKRRAIQKKMPELKSPVGCSRRRFTDVVLKFDASWCEGPRNIPVRRNIGRQSCSTNKHLIKPIVRWFRNKFLPEVAELPTCVRIKAKRSKDVLNR